MSVEISVSGKVNTSILDKSNHNILGCAHIIDIFNKINLEGKFVPNLSVIENNTELGCTITMPPEYKNKKKLSQIWNNIKYSLSNTSNIFLQDHYDCSHLKIEGEYQGCIYNYLKADFCPLKPISD
jgi:hypothetical protein